MNRTILEAVRAMLSESKLPKTFWAEAVSTAVYVKNRIPTSAHKNLTLYQALNGHKPNVQHFRTFGCMAYAHVPKD
ncbi:Ribonuclease H-like domain, partial [Trinorchestia longiramus]